MIDRFALILRCSPDCVKVSAADGRFLRPDFSLSRMPAKTLTIEVKCPIVFFKLRIVRVGFPLSADRFRCANQTFRDLFFGGRESVYV
jgi:hypothetical protein